MHRPRAHTHTPASLHDLLPESALQLAPSVLPTDTLLISNVPPSPDVSNAAAFSTLLSNFGTLRCIYSVVSSTGLVIVARFTSIASSINACTTLNNTQLYPGYLCIIGYIHILSVNIPSPPLISPPTTPKLPSLLELHPIFNKITNLIVANECITPLFNSTLNDSLNYNHASNLGPPPPLSLNTIDTPYLREIRRKIDNNHLTDLQSNELLSLLSENNQLTSLSNDHLGNTIIQHLITHSNAFTLDILITSISPYIQQISVHKNGTWVAQKLINSITTTRQMSIITTSLKPYIHLLFNDTYANYVIHALLKFSYPYNTIIFQALLSKFHIISVNRFGARAIRSCLEANYQPNVDNPLNDCCLLIIIAILAWSFNLIIDINGSLLINWFLDCELIIDRYYYLSYILVNDETYSNNNITFISLCNNKLGTLTLLKLLNYKNDTRIIDLLFNKIFNNLNEILNNGNISINFIHRLIHLQHIDVNLKNQLVNAIKNYLLGVEIQSNSLKRLADDVGFTIYNNRMRSNSDYVGGNHLRSRTNSLFNISSNRNFDELEIDKNILETLNSLGL